MRVMETHQKVPGCDIVCFAEVVCRDPFLLLGRTPRPDFGLGDLTSVRLATVSEVPAPWMCLQHDLRLAGIDPSLIDRVTDRTLAENAAALREGRVDVIQAFEPFASQLKHQRDELVRMVRAIDRAEKWVAQSDGKAIAIAIADFFRDVPAPVLEARCSRYKALAIWNETPLLMREGYERLRESLVSGRFVSSGTAFEVAVDNTLAEQVAAHALPPLR